MSFHGTFAPSPLTRALALMFVGSVSAVVSLPTHATTVVEDQLAIDASTPVDDYRVAAGATLTGEGASTAHIRAAAGASVALDNSRVSATGLNNGVELVGADATISGNSRIVSERQGLALVRTGPTGSTASVTDSYIEGAIAGAGLSAGSTLTLNNSELVGSGEGGRAAILFGDAQLHAQGGRLTGAAEGIQVFSDELANGAKVTLVGTRVEGLDGSAVVVGDEFGAASATIEVLEGATLVGSNGTLLDVVGGSDASLRANNSHLVGDVRVEAGSRADLTLENQASLTGRLENVERLALNSGARWNMVEDSTLANLEMSGGSVRFGEPAAYQRLTLENLSGEGTFIMDADFTTGQTDFLDVTGSATGQHSLLVGSSGADPVAENQLHLVHAEAGDASFELVNGRVDLGAFSYELVQRGQDWFLDGSRQVISPGTASVLALSNTAPTVWYGELSSLRSRMGELRLDERKSGAWARAYGNKYNVSAASGTPYTQTQQGFSLGADAPLPWGDGQWMAGVMAGHSSSDLSLARGADADVKSYYLGLYTTWLDAGSGYYFDGVLKVNRFDNHSKVDLSDGKRTEGDYDNMGVGGSVEFGRHVKLGNGYFIEPYTQWSFVNINGKDYSLDNGLQASSGDTRSLMGKAGATVGRNFDFGKGRVVQPYLRMAYVHEFADNNAVRVNDHRFDNDLSGSRGELGAGLAVTLMDRLQLHADFDYSNGEKIEQPWGANIGVHYSW